MFILFVVFLCVCVCFCYFFIVCFDYVSVNLYFMSLLFFFWKNIEDICFESFFRKKDFRVLVREIFDFIVFVLLFFYLNLFWLVEWKFVWRVKIYVIFKKFFFFLNWWMVIVCYFYNIFFCYVFIELYWKFLVF